MFNLIPWKKRHDQPASLTALADPFENRLAQFRNEFNSVLDRFWNNAFGEQAGSLTWGLGVDEDEHEYVVRAEAPGFEAADFDVQVRGNNLLIQAERKEEDNGKSGSMYRYGQLQRSVTLPYGAQTDNITAKYHSGVLELHVPKGEESKGKRIAVAAK